MADVLFIVIVMAFFGIMTLLVRFCDRVIGPDELTVDLDRDRVGADADTVSSEVGS